MNGRRPAWSTFSKSRSQVWAKEDPVERTYNVHKFCRPQHESWHITVLIALHAMKALSESKFTHDVEAQIDAPIAYIQGRCPGSWIRDARTDVLTPSAYVVQHEVFGRSKSAV